MRKNLRWIVLFACVLAIYGYSQYRDEHRDPTFETQLLDFKINQVERIEIATPEYPAFKLLREGPRWLLTYNNVHVEAYPLAVEELLQVLKQLTSSQIVSAEEKDLASYGLAPDQALKLCLYGQSPFSCLSFGRFIYDAEQENLRVYVRVNEGQEIYAADGLFLSKIEGDPRAYRPNLLWLVEGKVRRIDWQTPDTSFYIYQDSGRWHSETAALNQFNWAEYLRNIRYLSGTYFADDFDELRAPELLEWQLQLTTSIDTFILHCYRDTTRELPYIYHTRSKPEQWLAGDGSELYHSLASPWLKALNITHELE